MYRSTVGLLRGARLALWHVCPLVVGAMCLTGSLCVPDAAMGAMATLETTATGPTTLTLNARDTETRTAEKKAFSAYATASLPYGGLIHKDAVFSIVRAAAFLQATRDAAISLSQHTAAHIGAFALDRRIALAAAAYTPAVNTSVTDAPPPFDGQELLTVMVRLEAPLPQLDTRIRRTLQHPDTWALFEEVLVIMRDEVDEGSDLVQRAANLRQTHGSPMDEIFMHRINYLADQLDALWMYVQILHTLRTSWENPEQVQKHMQRALTLAPQSPLLWCALGETQLQLDFPQKAIESLDKAVHLGPTFARAYYARGLAHLRLQRSALAENDLSAALTLRPQSVLWLRARGAVRMVREDYGPMCADFNQACALGDCDGLMTARKRQLCLPITPPPKTPEPENATHGTP